MQYAAFYCDHICGGLTMSISTNTHQQVIFLALRTLTWKCVLLLLLAPCSRALYRGWFPVICSLCCSNFVYFYCFHSLKASWLRSQQSRPSIDLIIGIVAGEIDIGKITTTFSGSQYNECRDLFKLKRSLC